jgi:hypothetical protein
MKTVKTVLAVALFLFISSKVFSQGMTPPTPVNAPIFTALSGTWVSGLYEMMGANMSDEVTQNIVLNGQFFQVNVKSVSAGFVYEAVVMISPANDGTLTGWSYDIFGRNAITTYTGTWNEKMVSLDGTSTWGTESRIIAVEGTVMNQNVSFKMKGPDGKEMPEERVSIIYNKKM